jgi:hypothetical protein
MKTFSKRLFGCGELNYFIDRKRFRIPPFEGI